MDMFRQIVKFNVNKKKSHSKIVKKGGGCGGNGEATGAIVISNHPFAKLSQA